MPLKCDQKPPALTADALQLGSGLDLKSDMQGDFSKVINQLMQSMIPTPAPALGLNPQVQLQLLQQLLQLPVPMVPSAPLLQNSARFPSSSASAIDSNLIGQIQMLTQQLLNQTTPTPAYLQTGSNLAASEEHQRRHAPVEPPESDYYDDHRDERREMSSLDKRIMFMCQGGRDDPDASRSYDDYIRSGKAGQSKRLGQSELEEYERSMSEKDFASDGPFPTPNTPEQGSSLRSSLSRRPPSYDGNDNDDRYRRTPSSIANNDEDFNEMEQNGSGLDSASRCSDGIGTWRRSESSRGGERGSKRSRRNEHDNEGDECVDHRSKHESRPKEKKHKKSCSPAFRDGRSEGRKSKKRAQHDSRERRISREESKNERRSNRTTGSPERKRKRTDYTVEYGINLDDDDDDDVIFVDIQKKRVDVSRFLEKKLPSMKPTQKGTRSSSSSSVEIVTQDSNIKKRSKESLAMPPIKPNMMSACSTTLWIGHLNKLITEEELKAETTGFGEAVINLVPPRGCAFINFSSRADADRALNHLRNVSIQGNLLKVAWAAGVGIKTSHYYEKYDIDLGVTYIPWGELPTIDLPTLLEGSLVDKDSLPPNFDCESLTAKKSKKKKNQATPSDATDINPSLIPLPQALPPLPPPPPLPSFTNSTVIVSSSLSPMSFIQPPPIPNIPTTLPSATIAGYPAPLGIATTPSSNNSSVHPMVLPLPINNLPSFNPSIPPPFLHPIAPSMAGTDPATIRYITPLSGTSSSNMNSFGVANNIPSLPVLMNPNNHNQKPVFDGRTFINPDVRDSQVNPNPVDSNSTDPTMKSHQGMTSLSLPSMLRPSSVNPVVLLDKPQVGLLPRQHAPNFLVPGSLENRLTMPGCVMRPIAHLNNSFEQSLVKVAQMVFSDAVAKQEQNNISNKLMHGQGPRDLVVQQNVVMQTINAVPQMRPTNLLQPATMASMPAPMNHQEVMKRLPVPSEFLRRLGASTTSAPPQINTIHASKQVPLLPMPAGASLEVQTSSPGVRGQDEVRDALSPAQATNEFTKVQDSKPLRKQPLLETPIIPDDNSHQLHPSQMINRNHPAYNSLDKPKVDTTLNVNTHHNNIEDQYRTPRPPRIGERFDALEKQNPPPMVMNFGNLARPENIISEAIKSLSPLVRLVNPQGFLRAPLGNPAGFMASTPIVGHPRMNLRGPGIRGSINFNMVDRGAIANFQRSPIVRHRFNHNQQQQ